MSFATDWKEGLAKGKYHQPFSYLYGDAAQVMPSRYEKAIEAFESCFGTGKEIRIFSAPGRTEVGGNHTDHQYGCVLAAGVNLDVIAVVAPREDGIIHLQSQGYPMDTVDTRDLQIHADEEGKSAALIRGVCAGLKERGYKVGGFDAYTISDVLKGSGLSSSAAFEVLTAAILNGLYNDGSISPVACACISQYAENIYFGKPSGLMDQMASSVGGFVGIDFADPANPIIEQVSFDFAKAGYRLCIIDTGGNHADLTPEYAAIPLEMRSVASFFGKEVLRQVDESEFAKSIPAVRAACGDRACLRAMHFFAENRRAVEETKALQAGDVERFLNLVRQSGQSSLMQLQNIFSVSCPAEQGITVALSVAQQLLDGSGACRVHGGGFAGTIQAFVPLDRLSDFCAGMETVTGAGTCYVLSIRPVGGYELKA